MIHFLLVDDEASFLEALGRRLRQRGHRVECALSGQVALDRLEGDADLEIVLLDINMPDLDGIQVLARIKTAHPLVEVIMLTGHASIGSAVEAVKQGAFDYVEKPCDLDALVRIAEKAAVRKKDRESRLLAVKSTPYISQRERDELIASIMKS